MPKIIVTSRYLKSSKKKISNYVKYIATREGAARTKENYVGYLANRSGSHGLFSQKDEPINLEKTAREVANHNGNIWTHVVSLRREDAQKMGYDNLTAWRELVKRQIPNIAKQSKINLANLRWYAAFHDKETNPHVHIIVYSTDEREGFLSKQGIEKIRSGFANDIYADELHHLYAQQTNARNNLKAESEQLVKKIVEEISNGNCTDENLISLVKKLYEQLQNTKGKKVYGYLKKDTKKTVDEIFSRLAQNEAIQILYSLWCEMEQCKHDVYSSAKVDFPPLVDNSQFKSVKNMIVKAVADLRIDAPVFEEEIFHDEVENADNNFTDSSDVDEENYSKSSADESSETVSKLTENAEQYQNEIFSNTAFNLLVNLSRIIQEDYDKENRKLKSQVDSKLRRAIKRRKQGLGNKQENSQSY